MAREWLKRLTRKAENADETEVGFDASTVTSENYSELVTDLEKAKSVYDHMFSNYSVLESDFNELLSDYNLTEEENTLLANAIKESEVETEDETESETEAEEVTDYWDK